MSRNANAVATATFLSLLFLPLLLFSFTVVIDPGHGGAEKGAVQGDLVEKELVLRLSLKIENELRKRPGIRTLMTRTDDTALTLDERARTAKEAKADLLVSVHFNTDIFMLAETRGLEIYYPADDFSRPTDGALSLFHRNNRSFAAGKVLRDRYLQSKLLTEWKHDLNLFTQRDFRIFRLAPATPALLLEIGYLTAPEDRARIENEEFLNEIAAFIASAIAEYAEKKK